MYKKYKKDMEHSYVLGPFPVFELINNKPEKVIKAIVSQKFNDSEKLSKLCAQKGVEFQIDDKTLNRISDKEMCYAAAVFEKYNSDLSKNDNHVVLHGPSDMGNLGTIIRTILGFGIKDLAIIKPCADVFNPKVIRASMGAIFKLRIAIFESFEEYQNEYGEGRDLFPFMLNSSKVLTPYTVPETQRYTLIFGNEASGLPEKFEKIGKPLFINQSEDIDSLNLAVSVAVATYIFNSK